MLKVNKKINTYKKLGIIALCTGICTVAFGIYFSYWEYRKPLLEVYFFSLTRGRAVFIRTPGNKTILVGGGQTSETIRQITKTMPFHRRKIDYLIVPSATPAQIGGLVEILDRYEIGEIIQPKLLATSTALDVVRTKIRKNKIHVEEVERGEEVEIETGIKMKVLFPYEGFKYNKTSLPELGAAISYENTSVYLLGNLSKTVQKDISKTLEVKSDENIVEYYHSAIESRVSPDLLEKVDPKFTFSTKEKTMHMVSDGEKWIQD